MRWIGIDPGATGALAHVGDGILRDVVPMPSFDGYANAGMISEIIECWLRAGQGDCSIVIEQVHAMPKQGVSSSFKFGVNFGLALGAAQCSELPLHRLTPQKWKAAHTLVGKPKEASAARATELWPSMKEHWRLKKNVDLAEAALIAEAARRLLS